MYPCKKCGCCCRQIGKTIWGKELALPDGSCKYLNRQNNLCSIYETRPDICRIDDMYEKYLKNKMSKEEFYKRNQDVCRILRAKTKGIERNSY